MTRLREERLRQPGDRATVVDEMTRHSYDISRRNASTRAHLVLPFGVMRDTRLLAGRSHR